MEVDSRVYELKTLYSINKVEQNSKVVTERFTRNQYESTNHMKSEGLCLYKGTVSSISGIERKKNFLFCHANCATSIHPVGVASSKYLKKTDFATTGAKQN